MANSEILAVGYTPGPWRAEQYTDSCEIWPTPGPGVLRMRIAQLPNGIDPNGAGRAAANARLIAKAPEMAKVLKQLAEWIDYNFTDDFEQPPELANAWRILGEVYREVK